MGRGQEVSISLGCAQVVGEGQKELQVTDVKIMAAVLSSVNSSPHTYKARGRDYNKITHPSP